MKKIIMLIALTAVIHASTWQERFNSELLKCAEAKVVNTKVNCKLVGAELAERVSKDIQDAIDTMYLCTAACENPSLYYNAIKNKE